MHTQSLKWICDTVLGKSPLPLHFPFALASSPSAASSSYPCSESRKLPSELSVRILSNVSHAIPVAVGYAYDNATWPHNDQAVTTLTLCGGQPVCIAATSAAFTAINGGSLSDVILTAGVAYVSAEAFMEVGKAFPEGDFFTAAYLKRTLAHGVVGGAMAEASGGRFRDGFGGGGSTARRSVDRRPRYRQFRY